MSPATVILCLLILMIVLFSIKSYLKKLKSGCCGGGDGPERIRPDDADPAHYPCHRIVSIEGMSCRNCAARIESAFNARRGVLARVSLSQKRMDLYSLSPMDDALVRQIVARAGYTAKDIE